MARFEGNHSSTVTVTKPLAAAIAHFADPATVVANSEDVETAEIDGNTVHFVLKEQDHGIAKFQGRYSCQYSADGNAVRWATIGDSNTVQSGEAVFEAIDADSTSITYSESLAIDLDVPDMMAPMLKPVVSQLLAHELKGFLKRMVKTLES